MATGGMNPYPIPTVDMTPGMPFMAPGSYLTGPAGAAYQAAMQPYQAAAVPSAAPPSIPNKPGAPYQFPAGSFTAGNSSAMNQLLTMIKQTGGMFPGFGGYYTDLPQLQQYLQRQGPYANVPLQYPYQPMAAPPAPTMPPVTSPGSGTPSPPVGSPPALSPPPTSGGPPPSYITGDPWYMQFSGLLAAQGTSDASERAAKIQQALIGWGEVPSGYSSPDINATTGTLAGQNTTAGLSTLARLQKAVSDARRGSINSLAARGMLRSGETGFQLGEIGLAGKQQEFDARRSVMDYLSNVQSQYAQAESARKMQLMQAQFDAAQRQQQRLMQQYLLPG